MEPIKDKLDALFNATGKHYEALTYINHRDPQGPRLDRNKAELVLLEKLLTALAPFKEDLIKLGDYDI